MSIAEDIVKLNQRIHATTLVVSHDRDLAFGIAHRIAMLDEGHIVAIGTPDEIKRNPDPRVQQFLNASIARRLAVSAHLQPVFPFRFKRSVNSVPVRKIDQQNSKDPHRVSPHRQKPFHFVV